MSVVVAIAAFAPALLAFILAGFFALETALAFLGPTRRFGGSVDGPKAGPLAILIPAHDEAAVIAATLRSVAAAKRSVDRVLVVADNCADDTAAIARNEGVETIIRDDPARRGKGYALQFGIDHLRADPPFGVVIVDADCHLGDGAFDTIATAMASTGRPAQMLCLMRAPPDAPPQRRIAAFAWILINLVRMRGLMRLSGGARLTGAGMAMPWSIASRLDLASAEIVEDIALSTRLTEEGFAPVLVESARIESVFPVADAGAVTQRARWENGSLRLALTVAPRLILRALMKADPRLAAAGLDLAVPPMAVFGALILGSTAVSLVALAFGATEPLALSLTALTLYSGAIVAAWAGFGREALPARDIAGAGSYLADKISVYFGRGKASAGMWTRTARDEAKRGEERP